MTLLQLLVIVISFGWIFLSHTASATEIAYGIVFSGGNGEFDFDDVTLDIPSMSINFGSYGSFSGSFDAAVTANVFGNPPSTPFILQDNTFFPLGGGTASSLRWSSDGTYCLRPDNDQCGAGDLQSGTYVISVVPEPATGVLMSIGLFALANRQRRLGPRT